MKKFVLFVFIIAFVIFGYYYFMNEQNYLKQILKEVEKEAFYIDNYSIFGTHLNIEGCINKIIDSDLKLILKNKEEEIELNSNFDIKQNKTCFYLSKKNNEGIYLDELKTGNYLLLIKEETTDNILYYSLNNNTKYGNLEYYTITKNSINNKISILFDTIKNINYVEFKIKEEKLPKNVYDITIDPGHGGKDVGASGKFKSKTYYESDLTLKISLLLKSELEQLGLKVKLTRSDDSDLDPYGEGGRAVIPNDVKSKYSLSIHFNSVAGKMNYGGVEIYTPNDINYDFSKLLADNLAEVVGFSKKVTDRISNGIYYTYFTNDNIEDSHNQMIEDNMKPYDIKEGYPYMYMIREVGGLNTGAYIDGRNEYYGLNSYYNSNHTAEPYLLELAYINYTSDIKQAINNPEKFSNAISNAIKEFFNIS